ncbi:c-type lectin domain-containing protein [Trichonephila clavipes]|nr:c-type lectin domain-containing protein [Trichonephila clavipes]
MLENNNNDNSIWRRLFIWGYWSGIIPCHDSYARYIDYYGKCLIVVPDKENYMYAGIQCDNGKGHLFAYKSSDDTRSVASAIYSSVTIDGGIYAGLQKKSTGEWVYENGVKETSDSRWDSDDDREKDCAVYRFKRDGTLALFSMDCDMQHRVLCVVICADLKNDMGFFSITYMSLERQFKYQSNYEKILQRVADTLGSVLPKDLVAQVVRDLVAQVVRKSSPAQLSNASRRQPNKQEEENGWQRGNKNTEIFFHYYRTS